MQNRPLLRTGAAVAVTAALVLGVPLVAAAHVRVAPGTAEPGAEAVQLTFSVPNESAKATTTAVRIDLPTTTPFAYASVQPVAGWTAKVVRGTLPKPVTIDGTTVTEGPVRVQWTAEAGTKLTDGLFQNFVMNAGPVPSVGKLLLPASQTYSDGSVVEWNQPTPASGAEPEHPAPTVYIEDTPPSGDGSDGGKATTGPAVTATAGSDSSGPALGLSVGALVVALAGLLFGLVAFVRSRTGTRTT